MFRNLFIRDSVDFFILINLLFLFSICFKNHSVAWFESFYYNFYIWQVILLLLENIEDVSKNELQFQMESGISTLNVND